MTVFGDYARFYDLLYQEKDYEAECAFLEAVFERFAPRPIRAILDLGCGTGGHLIPLASRGHAPLAGVDRSEKMLATARQKAAEANAAIDFTEGDVREIRLDRTFDAAISMFAVMCYHTTNAELEAAVRTARAHLEPGGLFVFDAWFGPGVLSDPPTDRVKTIDSGDGERLIRITHPELDATRHTVDVGFHLLRLQGDRLAEEITETHRLRFLFVPEIEGLFDQCGFELLHVCPFLELGREITTCDWQMVVVGRAV